MLMVEISDDGNTMKWSVTLSNSKNSTTILNENMILVHGFLLTNQKRLRKELKLCLRLHWMQIAWIRIFLPVFMFS